MKSENIKRLIEELDDLALVLETTGKSCERYIAQTLYSIIDLLKEDNKDDSNSL